MKGRHRAFFVLGGVMSASLFGIPFASADDASAGERISERFTKTHLDREGDLRVTVSNGTATLEGVVTTLDARRRAEETAHREVKVVENRLRVVPEPKTDSEIRKAVVHSVLSYPRYTIFDSIDFAVEDGRVLLQGSVNQPYRKTDIERRIEQIPGVREIDDQIKVQSVSIFDDRLRRQLVRAIYGNDHFVQYAYRADPPIHIIVDKGQVTLTGFVATPVERMMLSSIAGGMLSFGVENQVKVDGEQHKEPGAHKSDS